MLLIITGFSINKIYVISKKEKNEAHTSEARASAG
jgi:hypothetical protein